VCIPLYETLFVNAICTLTGTPLHAHIYTTSKNSEIVIDNDKVGACDECKELLAIYWELYKHLEFVN